MSRLLCCPRRHHDMGAALSHQEGGACEGVVPVAPPTMADVIRERKKKAGGAALGTLRRRIVSAARRPRDARPDRGCEHARFIRSVVSTWSLAEVFVLSSALEAAAAQRDLATQADLARAPAAALSTDLAHCAHRTDRWCDVELVGAGWALRAHKAILAARSSYFRDLLRRYPGGRVPLEGAGAQLSRAEARAALWCAYAGASAVCRRAPKWEGAAGDLDIISADVAGDACVSGCACGSRPRDGAMLRRLCALLGMSPQPQACEMRHLLNSGEYADARLVFRAEGCKAAQYGFRSSPEIPCHRVVLAARSRFFRSVMSRRSSVNNTTGNSGAIYVDERVLPRRFARALLHAVYTDQVDLSLVERSASPTGSGGASSWGSGGRSAGAGSPSALEDAFQLYEIARFLEIPIAVQGCEDAIAEALSPESLPRALRWAAAPHASPWLHRQAMRYLRDEFPTIMAHPASAKLPRTALAEALSSPFLQASEVQILRALLKWGEATKCEREPNVVWHTAHSAARRGARRRDASDAALKETLASLLPLVRLEHIPPDNDTLQQCVRRGLVPAPAAGGGSSLDAWLGSRAPRCFLPHLDELKALLEGQPVPEGEVARARRARCVHRVPDALYMVASVGSAAAESTSSSHAENCCVSPRTLAALRARARELRTAPPALRALRSHCGESSAIYRQIALRAVRELALPDSCADLLMDDMDSADDGRTRADSAGSASSGWESPRGDAPPAPDCCRSLGARRGSAHSLRAQPSLHIPIEGSRLCRREAIRDARAATWAARLSAAVPDVAMPNANTHLLTAHYTQPAAEYGGAGGAGGGLQLDLGDGATHTPRPGSRAMRATHGPGPGAGAAVGGGAAAGGRREEEAPPGDLRVRVYSAQAPPGGAGGAGGSLPRCYRADQHHLNTMLSARRGSPSPVSLLASAPAHVAHVAHTPHTPHRPVHRAGSGGAGGLAGALAGAVGGEPRAYRHYDYRLEAQYGSSSSTSRGPSPNYA